MSISEAIFRRAATRFQGCWSPQYEQKRPASSVSPLRHSHKFSQGSHVLNPSRNLLVYTSLFVVATCVNEFATITCLDILSASGDDTSNRYTPAFRTLFGFNGWVGSGETQLEQLSPLGLAVYLVFGTGAINQPGPAANIRFSLDMAGVHLCMTLAVLHPLNPSKPASAVSFCGGFGHWVHSK